MSSIEILDDRIADLEDEFHLCSWGEDDTLEKVEDIRQDIFNIEINRNKEALDELHARLDLLILAYKEQNGTGEEL